MRTLLITAGLLVLAVGLCSAEPLSFDDLYKAADSFDDPQPVKKAAAEPEDPEMKEWSTEHLLGLDEPVPEHMFDDVQAPKKKHTERTAAKKSKKVEPAAKKAAPEEAKLVEEIKPVAPVAHKVTKTAPQSHKKAAKASQKQVHMVNPHEILSNIHQDAEDKSADDFADMLIGTEDVEPAQPTKRVVKKTTKIAKKVATVPATKKAKAIKQTKVAEETAKKAEPNEDEQLMGAKLPHVHHAAKKPAHLSLPHIVEDGDDEPELTVVSHRPLPASTLQGMASKMLQASEEKDHVSDTKQANAEALTKKKEKEQEKEQKAEENASNGHVVHLDLSADSASMTEAPKAEEEQNLSDMLSIGDDDDDE